MSKLTSLGAAAVAVWALAGCGPDGAPEWDLQSQGFGVNQALPGVDRAGVLSTTEATGLKSSDGIVWTGAYVGGPCNGGSGWTKAACTSLAAATSWSFMPIYVGQQSSSICSASTLTAAQGTADGNEAVAIMGQYAWAPNSGIPVVLDLEAGTYSGDSSGATAYTQAWAAAVKSGGYLAYVYSSPSALLSFAQGGLPLDGVWIASWQYTSFQSGLSPYSETSLGTYFTNHNRAWQYAGAGNYDYSTADITLAPAPGQINAPSPTLDQLAANDAISAVSWPDGHAEVFFHSTQSQLMHVWTADAGETWGAGAALDTGAQCGSSAIFWPSPWTYAEAFSPLNDGGTGHLWETNNTWNTFQPLGGTQLADFQTVTWQDGHTEVFARDSSGAVSHQWWDLATSAWSGWQSLGGTLQRGPSPIIWGDGHGELFGTGAGGAVTHASTGASGWSTWSPLTGSLASSPVPIRLKNGNVNVYGIGTDGLLYESAWNNGWPAFSAIESTTTLVGQPSAIVNADDTVELFARDQGGRVVHTRSGASWSPVQPVGTAQVAASDPFGWVRTNGTVDVFAVDEQGAMRVSHRDSSNTWGTWTALASSVAPCSNVGLTDGGSPQPDAGHTADGGGTADGGTFDGGTKVDAGGGTDGGTQPQPDSGSPGQSGDAGTSTGPVSGCGCASPGGAPVVLMAALLVLARRRRGKNRWVRTP